MNVVDRLRVAARQADAADLAHAVDPSVRESGARRLAETGCRRCPGHAPVPRGTPAYRTRRRWQRRRGPPPAPRGNRAAASAAAPRSASRPRSRRAETSSRCRGRSRSRTRWTSRRPREARRTLTGPGALGADRTLDRGRPPGQPPPVLA
jgi:hypothetical protein